MNDMRELELYIHIPFCVKKCAYCDFLSAPASVELQKEYVKALENEIRAFSNAENYKVSTAFFGGGTPSILKAGEIERIMNVLRTRFAFAEDAEISIECNPGTASEEKLKSFLRAGINRISFGLQSAENKELKALGRIHTWEEFLNTYQMARMAGFQNINVDLMSGLPHQTTESWEKTLKSVLALKPEHISAYGLIIEEGTPFYELYGADAKKRERGETPELLPSEEDEREMYHRTRIILEENGYHRYEISNYSLAGKECRHNLGYWTGIEYAGFGLGASSLINHSRIKHTSDLPAYLAKYLPESTDILGEAEKVKALHNGEGEERTALSEADEIEEYMFLGLRTMQGVSETDFRKHFGCSMQEVYGAVIDRFLKKGLLQKKQDRISLTEAGIDISNYILAEFLEPEIVVQNP